MQRILQFFTLLIITSILSSCSKNSESISDIKLIPVSNGNEFQYIDKEGKIIINPQFTQASVFREGLALVNTGVPNDNGDDTGYVVEGYVYDAVEYSDDVIDRLPPPKPKPKWGFISEDGKHTIAPAYKYATVFSEDLAWVVSENAAPTAINKKGEIKITLKDAEKVKIFKEGLSAFAIIDKGEIKWGFIDKSGQVKITPQFSATKGNFSEGKCAVRNSERKWGYIDKNGKIVINYQFEYADKFINGRAVVYSGEKAGIIDETGKYVINPQFSDVISDNDDTYLICQNKKWGWCDKEGKIVINPQFDVAYPFKKNKLAAVRSGKSWGYIDKEGKIIINPQFDVAYPYNGEVALVESDRQYGFIDKNGKYVINPQFDGVPEDLLRYIIYGGSKYEWVETDFFNIKSNISKALKKARENWSEWASFLDAFINNEKPIKESGLTEYRDDNSWVNIFVLDNCLVVSYSATFNNSCETQIIMFDNFEDIVHSSQKFFVDGVVGKTVLEISTSGYDENGRWFREGTFDINSRRITSLSEKYH